MTSDKYWQIPPTRTLLQIRPPGHCRHHAHGYGGSHPVQHCGCQGPKIWPSCRDSGSVQKTHPSSVELPVATLELDPTKPAPSTGSVPVQKISAPEKPLNTCRLQHLWKWILPSLNPAPVPATACPPCPASPTSWKKSSWSSLGKEMEDPSLDFNNGGSPVPTGKPCHTPAYQADDSSDDERPWKPTRCRPSSQGALLPLVTGVPVSHWPPKGPQ